MTLIPNTLALSRLQLFWSRCDSDYCSAVVSPWNFLPLTLKTFLRFQIRCTFCPTPVNSQCSALGRILRLLCKPTQGNGPWLHGLPKSNLSTWPYTPGPTPMRSAGHVTGHSVLVMETNWPFQTLGYAQGHFSYCFTQTFKLLFKTFLYNCFTV